MSASRERKKRLEQDQIPASEKEKKKLSEGIILAISIVLVLAVVFGGILIYRSYWRNATVLTVGDHKVSVKEFNYFFRGETTEMVNTYGSYLSFLGIDINVGLNHQTAAGATEDGEAQTWAAYFADSAMNAACAYYAVYDQAMANGFTLSDDARADIDKELSTLKTYASLYGMDEDDYVAAMFGSGCDIDGYEAYLELAYTYSEYLNSLTYTEEELSARYAQDPTEFDTVSFLLYRVSASEFVETDEEGNAAEVTDAERKQAKAAADEMVADFRAENDGVSEYDNYFKSEVENTVSEEAATWIFGGIEADTVKQFVVDDTYYVLKFISRSDNDYASVNALQIYIPNDSDEEDSTDDTTEEATAEEKLKAIREALASDASQENFEALVTEYSGSTISKGTLRTVTNEDMAKWFFEDKPAAGEYKEFTNEGGTYIVMFTGNDESYKDLLVTNALVNEWHDATIDAVTYEYDEERAMHANVDLVLSEVYNLSGSNSSLLG